MPIRCFISPASTGKTNWVIQQALRDALDLQAPPRILVPSRLLEDSITNRLADRGGSLGIWVGTFSDLGEDVLEQGGKYPVQIIEIVSRQVLQQILQTVNLTHYESIKDKPGFRNICLDIIRELKAGAILPGQYIAAVNEISGSVRLQELGLIYQAYHQFLREKNWVDSTGLIWQAAETHKEESRSLLDAKRLYLDGFDDMSPIQLELIRALSAAGQDIVVTLTGKVNGDSREIVHKRFHRLREMLTGIGATIDSLDPESGGEQFRHGNLEQLSSCLFVEECQNLLPDENRIELIAVPDREAEVRTALRWLRKKVIDGSISLSETSLLMRNLESYQSLIIRIAGEYELPIRMIGGIPLIENPAVAAVMALLRLVDTAKDGLIWHQVISLWQSPYFNWETLSAHPDSNDISIDHTRDARQLEKLARWGQVIQGYSQWQEAFKLLLDQEHSLDSTFKLTEVKLLWEKFNRFVDLVESPQRNSKLGGHIRWLEELLGISPEGERNLGVIDRILAGPPDLIERDWRALEKLEQILSQMLFADQLLDGSRVTFSDFIAELESNLNQTKYQPLSTNRNAILCADCREVRGLPFKAAALIGIAEGEFPASIREDPILRDGDREKLNKDGHLPLRPSLESAEAEFFYEAISRPSQYLLLTRPRIADNGAPWQPSPYWEEVEQFMGGKSTTIASSTSVPLELAASWSEFLEVLAVGSVIQDSNLVNTADQKALTLRDVARSSAILKKRMGSDGDDMGVFEGDLPHLAPYLQNRFHSQYIWSSSKLESYRTCPLKFFIERVLGLEELQLPEEGLDARQLGNIYHNILEDLYSSQPEDYNLQDLLAGLPKVANEVFESAPRKEGFRESAWWDQTQQEILTNLEYSLIVLESIQPGYRFYRAEQRFGIDPDGIPVLEIRVDQGGRYLLRGLIDRVDISHDGKIRIVDYKTSSPWSFNSTAVRDGKKLQLPLYALAAESILGDGKVQEGFYFHVQAAKPSPFKMSTFQAQGVEGPGAAMRIAAEHGWDAVSAIREGKFAPRAPDGGCPSYCPAVGFCWKYQSGRW